MKQSLAIFVATGAYSGYSPYAPGTAGSFLAVVLLYFVPSLPLFLHIAVTLFLFLVGVWVCNAVSQVFDKVDSPKIVIDEIVGILITMIGIPVTSYWLVAGFCLFRFFDIVKLPPANSFDKKLKNGWGVMLDDVIAGIYSNLILQLMLLTQL